MSSLRPSVRARRKFLSVVAQVRAVRKAHSRHQTVVFTNGCFDLLHAGHVKILEQAKRFGNLLVVAINSDASVRGLKGPGRPIVSERDRALLLAALECVDYVTVFPEPTPQRLVSRLRPNVLMKGADWGARQIIGRDIVERSGGRVIRVPLLKGYSTTRLIERVRSAF